MCFTTLPNLTTLVFVFLFYTDVLWKYRRAMNSGQFSYLCIPHSVFESNWKVI